MAQMRATDAKQLAEVVTWAVAEEQPLELVAGGSKRGLGRPMQVEHVLDISSISGIVEYEPAELVMTARAATPLSEIEAALQSKNQMLAFEPPDWGPLFESNGNGQTIGGVVACNLSGPRRIKGGAARDHFLGFSAVNGRGEQYKAGGKVVKNVTGYDLCKLLAGSYGTLGALTEVSLKVLPRPETACTVLITGLDPARAFAALSEGLNSPHEAAGAAHLPMLAAQQSQVGAIASAGAAVTALRVEGPGPSVAYRAQALTEMMREHGATEILPAEDSDRLWREIRDASFLVEPRDRAVWRISVAPSAGPAVAADIANRIGAQPFFDWCCGLIWASVGADQGDAGADAIRTAIKAHGGGHATLLRAPESLRASVHVFEPLPGPLAALTARVKESFDPRRIFNPGRMYAGV